VSDPKQSPDAPRARFAAGAHALAPAFVGMVPFGLVTGVVSIAAGLTPVEALVMSFAAFSGIVQIVCVQLYAAGAPLVVIFATAVILSLRLMMYSAGLAPWLGHMPLRWKSLFAYLITDNVYAVSVVEFTHHPNRTNKHWFSMGAAAVGYCVWQTSVVVGVVAGAQLPASWSLDFAFTLTFLALLAAVLIDRPSIVAALVGGVAALAAYYLPYRLGMVTAGIAGVAAGLAWSTLERAWSGR
jgi:predicted branched-subunit amino acid permease